MSIFANNANNQDVDPWSMFSRMQKRPYSSKFDIKNYDDHHVAYDFQSGLVYWFQDGSAKVITENPDSHTYWYKDQMTTHYISDLDRVIISDFNDHNGNIVYELLMADKKQLKSIYNLQKKPENLTLVPKEKSIIKKIEVFYTKSQIPYRFIIFDQLGYQTVLTLQHPKTFSKQKKNLIDYPKTAEVRDHVRHSVI